MALDSGVRTSQRIREEQSASVDSLFEALKEAKKDQDDLLKKQLEIRAKDTERINKAVIEGSTHVVTSEGVKSLAEIDPGLETARQDIQSGKAARAASQKLGGAVATEAVKQATLGDDTALRKLQAGDIDGAINAISPPGTDQLPPLPDEEPTITPQDATAQPAQATQPTQPAGQAPTSKVGESTLDKISKIKAPKVDPRTKNLTTQGEQQKALNEVTLKEIGSEIDLDQNIRKSLADKLQTNEQNFARFTGLMSTLVATYKAKLAAQGGKGGGLPTAIATLKKNIVQALGAEAGDEVDQLLSAIEGFPAQKIEAALGLNNIVTGQNRAIKGIIDMITATLPPDFATPAGFETLMSQSLENAFRLNLAIRKSAITIKDIDIAQATREEKQMLKDLNQGEDAGISRLVDKDGNELDQKAVERVRDSVILSEQEKAELQAFKNAIFATETLKPGRLDRDTTIDVEVGSTREVGSLKITRIK